MEETKSEQVGVADGGRILVVNVGPPADSGVEQRFLPATVADAAAALRAAKISLDIAAADWKKTAELHGEAQRRWREAQCGYDQAQADLLRVAERDGRGPAPEAG